MQKKKIEHYVPQCYLEKWCMPDSKHVNVFDKEQDKSRTNHIEDVASEKYFYDIDLSGVLTKEEIKFYNLEGVDLSKIDDKQYIENFFSKNVESAFKYALDDIVSRVRKMTPWQIKHCTFISRKRIHLFSLLMAFQYVRVKDIRNSLEELVDMLNQALSEHSASQEMIDKYGSISKKELKYVHGKIICNIGEISKIANTFSKHIWLLFKNTTIYSRDEDVDAVGACIGNHGMRISGIVDELRGEKIDIVKYSEAPEEYVAAALAPATVRSVEMTGERSCKVIVDADQLSLAIGKEGQNARLAARLTGMKIDIKSE